MTIYWNNATGSRELLSQHEGKIQELLAGRVHSKQLEKLRNESNYPVYSLRLNVKERLLFTTHRGYLHVLEHMTNHKYERSVFIKYGVNEEEINKGILFTELTSENERPVFNEDSNPKKIIQLYPSNKEFIALSHNQEHTLYSIDPSSAHIISGLAGSGKTLLSLIISAAQIGKRVLYVSNTKKLVARVETIYRNSVVENRTNIEFIPYDNLLSSTPFELVNFDFFEQWYNNLKTKALPVLDSAISSYQEFYICSGFFLEHYCDLGVRQSSIPRDSKMREDFYKFYQSYLSYLAENHKRDPAFSPVDEQIPQYDLVIVDETQGMSSLQVRELARLSNSGLIFCMDQNQNLVSSLATRLVTEQILRQNNILVTTHTLGDTWRSKKKVVKVLDNLLRVSRLIRNGVTDKYEALEMNANPDADEGIFRLMSPNDKIPEGLMKQLNSTEMAVVTTTEHIAEALSIFDTELIFTPDEIMGQEFHTVVLYKLLDNAHAKNILKEIYPLLKSTKAIPHNRPKILNSRASVYSPWINTWFTSCSRAQDTLVIIDSEPKKTACFLEQFERIKSSDNIDFNCNLSTNWDAMAKQQQQFGNAQIAERIKTRYLSQSQEQSSSSQHNKKASPKAAATPTIATPPLSGEKSGDLGLSIATVKAAHQSNKKSPLSTSAAFKMTNSSPVPSDKQVLDAILQNDLLLCNIFLFHPLFDINNIKNHVKQPFLTFAIRMKTSMKVFNLLLTHPKIDVNTLDPEGLTPLMIAIIYRQTDKIDALLAHSKINVNAVFTKNPPVNTLGCAVESGDLETIKKLMEHPKIDKSSQNRTYFQYALETARSQIKKRRNDAVQQGSNEKVAAEYIKQAEEYQNIIQFMEAHSPYELRNEKCAYADSIRMFTSPTSSSSPTTSPSSTTALSSTTAPSSSSKKHSKHDGSLPGSGFDSPKHIKFG